RRPAPPNETPCLLLRRRSPRGSGCPAPFQRAPSCPYPCVGRIAGIPPASAALLVIVIAPVLLVIVIAPAVMPTPFGVFIAERSSVLGHLDFVPPFCTAPTANPTPPCT